MLAGSKRIDIIPRKNIAIVSFSGMGHIIPILQLAQCMGKASDEVHITVFTQLAARDLCKLPEKLPPRTELVLMTEPTAESTVYNSLDFADRDLNGDHVRFITGYFRERRTRPVIVVNGLLVYCGVELARYYRAKLWAFNASCLLSLTIYAVDIGRVSSHRLEPRNSRAAISKTSVQRYGGEPPFAACQCTYKYHRGPRVAYTSPVIGDILYEDMPVQPPRSLSIHEMFDKSFDVMVNKADQILCNDLTAFSFPEALNASSTGDAPLVLQHAFSLNTLDAVWEEKVMSRVVNIGPLCALDTRVETTTISRAALWLKEHKPRAVVYVSLGSWCELSTPDLARFCDGLEACGHPILWAFRGQSRPETVATPDTKLLLPRAEEDEVSLEPVTETGLPAGWEERMSPRLLLLPWVNQIEVLSHPAVGCFVTHCGWNSMLEAITYSTLPLVGVPLGAEQALDSRLIAEVFHSGVRVKQRLDEKLEAGVLAEAICEVMTRPRYTLNATRLHKIAFSQIGAGTRALKQLLRDE